jgi:hypothetical protein
MNTYKISLGGNIVEYRCFIGNSKIVYLKATMATYLELGRRLHTSYDCSVICVLGFGSPNTDKRIMDDFIKRHKIMDAEMFYVSHAKGCFDGLELAGGGVSFKKMVFVNMPLDEKFDNVLTQLKAIPETKIVAIFAEKVHFCESILFLKNVDVIKTRDAYNSCKIAIAAFKELG